MGLYNARVTRGQGGADVLHASRTLAPIGAYPDPISICTSADISDPDLRQFTRAARAAYGARAENGGHAKGRVLFVRCGQRVLAFLCVHVPPSPGPLICDGFATDPAASSDQIAVMREHLLEAGREMSEGPLERHAGIAWATNDRDFRDNLRTMGFRTVAMPAGSDCDRRYYLERS